MENLGTVNINCFAQNKALHIPSFSGALSIGNPVEGTPFFLKPERPDYLLVGTLDSPANSSATMTEACQKLFDQAFQNLGLQFLACMDFTLSIEVP